MSFFVVKTNSPGIANHGSPTDLGAWRGEGWVAYNWASTCFILKSKKSSKEEQYGHLLDQETAGVFVCWGLSAKYHRLSGLNNIHVLSHSLEARSPRSRCGQGWSSWGWGKTLLQAPLLLVVADHPWLLEAPPQSLPSCLHDILLVCLSVSHKHPPFYKYASHIALGLTPMPSF